MNILKSLVIIVGILSLVTFSTNSIFTSEIRISDNQFETGQFPTPTPSPTPIGQARVVINEVYYDVAPDKGGDGNVANSGEWLELYNAGTASVNLKDWTITDNTTIRTIQAASHTLVPGGYALIAKDNSLWSLYWSVPNGVEIVELGNVIGNGLANGGDRLILKDDSSNIIDQISWESDTVILNPSITGVAEGHSIERNPAGLDTNTAADFVDRAIPTPGS